MEKWALRESDARVSRLNTHGMVKICDTTFSSSAWNSLFYVYNYSKSICTMLNKKKCGLHKTGFVVQGTRTCETQTRRMSPKFVKKIKGGFLGQYTPH